MISAHSLVIEDRLVHKYASSMGDLSEYAIANVLSIKGGLLYDEHGLSGKRSIQDRQQFQTTLIPDTRISDPFSSRNFGCKTSPSLPKLRGPGIKRMLKSTVKLTWDELPSNCLPWL